MRPGERIYEDGFYYQRLARYFQRFSRDRIHVMLYDDFAAAPRDALRTLFEFLGVAPDAPIDISTRHNPAGMPRSAILNRVIWGAIPLAHTLLPSKWRGSGFGERLLRKTYQTAPTCPSDLRRRLRDCYREDVMATAALIGRDLTRWLEA
jgi:hypothetical protein